MVGRGLKYRGRQRDIRKLPYSLKARRHLLRSRLVALTPERLGEPKHRPTIHGVLLEICFEDYLRLGRSVAGQECRT